jgi:hypothetical protein
MSLNVSYFPFVGVLSDVAKISVTDASATSHTISSGKKGVIFMNTGTGICWLGGSTVDPGNSRGLEILPKTIMQFDKAKTDFKAWFKCDTGVSTTISIVEYS